MCERVSESAEMETACVCVCVDNERSGLGHPCAHHHTIKYSSVLIKQDTGRRSGGTALERPTICKKRNEMGWNVLQSEVSRWTWHQNYCSFTDVSSDMRMMMREDRKWEEVMWEQMRDERTKKMFRKENGEGMKLGKRTDKKKNKLHVELKKIKNLHTDIF